MERIGSLLSVGQRWSVEPFEENSGPPTDRRPLRLAALHDPPYFIANRLANDTFSYSGYLKDLWEIIARELDLPYEIIPLFGGGYGSVDPNGTWTGMVGELAYGRADLALTGIIHRRDRATVVDYIDTVAVSQDRPTFYVRRDAAAAPRLSLAVFDALLRPLHAHIWWLLLASLLVTSLVLRATVRFNHAGSETRRTAREMSWAWCLLLSFMTLVNQGWARTPDSLAARVATLAGWILGMLVYYTYTANLISHLTVTTVGRPISSLREFIEQPGWTFAMEPGYGILNTWKTSSDPYERALYARTVTGEGFLGLEVGGEVMRRTTEPKMMTYIDIDRLLKFIGSEGCQMVSLLANLPPKTNNYMIIAKGRRQLREDINHLMEHLNHVHI
ncbi:glutamate receptor ionotropic, delta-1-like [Amphibalanus amphitrite]|uniref:glutamate receptor ionotropic, delta-1-like n=1 Tax=Amphibalanus amphitrite TaxID=1232801 RepID=UPI001C9243F6|nr:glutamate receptor ionotropic, delta-1-like [Amphibalanus amphitrite]